LLVDFPLKEKLQDTSTQVIGVDDSSSYSESGPQTSIWNHRTNWQHNCTTKCRSKWVQPASRESWRTRTYKIPI